MNSLKVKVPVETSNTRASTLVLQASILQAIILILLNSIPAIAQSNNTTANTATATTTPPLTISESSSAAPSYPPQSESFKSARKLLLAGHYEQYVQQLEKLAAEGDMQCLDELANLYNTGRIVGQDHKRAFAIWQELAEKNYPPAFYNLAGMYFYGYACSKDYKKVFSLLSQTSSLGCDFGAGSLAYMYREGYGCKTDYAKALGIYEQLIARNSPLGWYGKAHLVWKGLGVKQNPVESTALLTKAAEAGLPEAQYRLADNYYYGMKIPTNYKLARFWAQRGSDQGNVACQLQLADFKMDGVGGEKDSAGGISLLKGLANQSILEAQKRLGHAYRKGNGVTKDLVLAKMWLEKAANRDYVLALNELADMYFVGDGVPKNLEKWFELNMKAAGQTNADTQNHARCQYNVGLAYDHGWGVKKDLNQARIWYAKAATAGNPHACNNLSLIYLDGLGCPANKSLAMTLRKQGAANGCWMACTNLGQDYANGRNGVGKNIHEAVRLFKKSVELCSENPTANWELARIYEKGMAGKVDLKLADKYYREAAKYGCEAAIRRGSIEKTVSFNTPVALPKHRSAYINYNINPRKARYFIHVPQSYTAKQKFGLIVYIDTYDKALALPYGWLEVLAKRHLLFLCPQNAGNSCDANKRAGLAVLGALEMLQKYNIDKTRVYAAGLVGGARIASDLGFNQSDVFCGTIQSCGSNFYRAVQKRFPITNEESGAPYGLCEATAAEVADARKKVKFALITGNDDFRRSNVLNIYHEGFAKEGFRAKLFEVDKIGTNDCDGKTLEQVLDFIQKGL